MCTMYRVERIPYNQKFHVTFVYKLDHLHNSMQVVVAYATRGCIQLILNMLFWMYRMC